MNGSHLQIIILPEIIKNPFNILLNGFNFNLYES